MLRKKHEMLFLPCSLRAAAARFMSLQEAKISGIKLIVMDSVSAILNLFTAGKNFAAFFSIELNASKISRRDVVSKTISADALVTKKRKT